MHMVPTSGRNSLTEETANTHTVPHIRTKDVLSVGTDSKGVNQRGQEWPRNGQGKLHGGGGLGRPRGSRASRGEEERLSGLLALLTASPGIETWDVCFVLHGLHAPGLALSGACPFGPLWSKGDSKRGGDLLLLPTFQAFLCLQAVVTGLTQEAGPRPGAI